MTAPTRRLTPIRLLLIAASIAVPLHEALALITGGVGNAPLQNPGWPNGGAAVFNHPSRVAWWEGPPFGGGQWHAECRGDAQALNAVLADFAKLDVKTKKIVLHNGVGKSFWLGRGGRGEEGRAVNSEIDWQVMLWNPESWKQLRKLPADFNPIGAGNEKDGPPAQIDIYTGGNVKWADVVVPKGLAIDDQRLEAHGFTAADGSVLVGRVTDLVTGKPLAAKTRLEMYEAIKKGGYRYTTSIEAATDADGKWTMKKAPVGHFRIIVEADGYVPRVVGHVQLDGQPKWHSHNAGLARPAEVKGRVVGEDGKPLADVEVRLADVEAAPGGRYESARADSVKTDADGRLRAESPVGKAAIWLTKDGYCRPGLGAKITPPQADIELKMVKTARLVVTVDFTGVERPADYMVHMAPEGGSKIGSYGGSGRINEKREMIFDNVPPGRYVLHGRPNPGSDNQQTEPFTVDLKGGLKVNVTLLAR